MRRRDSRMPIESTDAYAAQGTTMGVCGNDGPPETLVADGWKVGFAVYVRFGRSPDRKMLEEEPIPLRFVRRFRPYGEIPDGREVGRQSLA
jgi:hypothetical protein